MLNSDTRDMTLTMAYHGALSAAEINLSNVTSIFFLPSDYNST
jgi:hypothetical protein